MNEQAERVCLLSVDVWIRFTLPLGMSLSLQVRRYHKYVSSAFRVGSDVVVLKCFFWIFSHPRQTDPLDNPPEQLVDVSVSLRNVITGVDEEWFNRMTARYGSWVSASDYDVLTWGLFVFKKNSVSVSTTILLSGNNHGRPAVMICNLVITGELVFIQTRKVIPLSFCCSCLLATATAVSCLSSRLGW